ncbi:unnamed protein product [Ilex paraguariensis]|uniref:Uncharacterized protein n=1 Tax=Ilex paraguariensis TaxID=185542 RepID=A0ABC8SQP7_9AQUA
MVETERGEGMERNTWEMVVGRDGGAVVVTVALDNGLCESCVAEKRNRKREELSESLDCCSMWLPELEAEERSGC